MIKFTKAIITYEGLDQYTNTQNHCEK